MADVSDIFYFFFCSGRGKGESEAAGRGGVDFALKIPEGGGSPGGAEGSRGREGVCGQLGIWGGGGAKYFFSGPKCPPSKGPNDFSECVKTCFSSRVVP